MGFSSNTPNIPSSPAFANLLFTNSLPPSVAKDVEILPRTTIVASQVGNSFFGQSLANNHFVGRMVVLPSISIQEKRSHDEKKRDRIRGVIVTKTDESSDTSDRPKDQ
jgi:hypothetical protein